MISTEVPSFGGNRVNDRLGAGGGARGPAGAGGELDVVERRPAAARGCVSLVQRRRVDDARDRAPIDDERGRDRPARIADHKRASAVDRVDDDEAAAGEAFEIVDGLLREPTRLGQGVAQAALEQRIGGEIGGGDRRAADFRLHLRRGARSRPEVFERQRPRLTRGGGQEIARGKRVNVRVNAQWRDVRSGEKGLRLGFSRGRRRAQSRNASALPRFRLRSGA